MTALYAVLLVLALGCFVLAAFKLVAEARVNLVALGFSFWVLVPLLSLLQRLSNQ